MRKMFKFILFALLFNFAAFFIASTGWFPNTLYGNAVSDLSLNDPATLSSAEDIFMRMVENDVGANIIANAIGLGTTASFALLMAGFIGGSALIGWLSKGSGTTIVGMAVVSYLFYTMYVNSKTFFDNLLSNMPAQVSYITVMILFGMLFMFILVLIDFSSGQRSSS